MSQEDSNNVEGISESKLHMLRCLIAIAHADNIFHEKEKEYIKGLMDKNPISEEQRSTLDNDMVDEQDIGEMYNKITEPKYKGQVVYFMRLMAQKDGVYDISEKDLVDRLNSLATENLDIAAISAEAKKVAQADLKLHEASIDKDGVSKNGKRISYFQWLDDILARLGIGTMRD